MSRARVNEVHTKHNPIPISKRSDTQTLDQTCDRVTHSLVDGVVLDTEDALCLRAIMAVGSRVDRLDLGCVAAGVRRALGPVVLECLCVSTNAT